MSDMLDEGRTLERVVAMVLAMLFGFMLVLAGFTIKLVPVACGRICGPGELGQIYAAWAVTLLGIGGLTYLAYGQIERPRSAVLFALTAFAALAAAGAYSVFG